MGRSIERRKKTHVGRRPTKTNNKLNYSTKYLSIRRVHSNIGNFDDGRRAVDVNIQLDIKEQAILRSAGVALVENGEGIRPLRKPQDDVRHPLIHADILAADAERELVDDADGGQLEVELVLHAWTQAERRGDRDGGYVCAGESRVQHRRYEEGFLSIFRPRADLRESGEVGVARDGPSCKPVCKVPVGEGVDGVAFIGVSRRGEAGALVAVATGAHVTTSTTVARVRVEVEAQVAALVRGRRGRLAVAHAVQAVRLVATALATTTAVLAIASAQAAYPLARFAASGADGVIRIGARTVAQLLATFLEVFRGRVA